MGAPGGLSTIERGRRLLRTGPRVVSRYVLKSEHFCREFRSNELPQRMIPSEPVLFMAANALIQSLSDKYLTVSVNT